ncbi:MAG TPA: zinc-finger domain-containing protein [Hellea balneolensis]|uniref:Zinc-finger domain-containing protein n=1 Tax=Hellea balneolensis TaxID=287478 RepID=A0A7V5NXC1_9PROT|nr:zinc-finger domain-containing protein [Hellea balneolensis]
MSETTSTVCEPETTYVTAHKVACDGGAGPLGHPRVFLDLDPDGRVECKYCGHVFVLKQD